MNVWYVWIGCAIVAHIMGAILLRIWFRQSGKKDVPTLIFALTMNTIVPWMMIVAWGHGFYEEWMIWRDPRSKAIRAAAKRARRG